MSYVHLTEQLRDALTVLDRTSGTRERQVTSRFICEILEHMNGMNIYLCAKLFEALTRNLCSPDRTIVLNALNALMTIFKWKHSDLNEVFMKNFGYRRVLTVVQLTYDQEILQKAVELCGVIVTIIDEHPDGHGYRCRWILVTTALGTRLAELLLGLIQDTSLELRVRHAAAKVLQSFTCSQPTENEFALCKKLVYVLVEAQTYPSSDLRRFEAYCLIILHSKISRLEAGERTELLAAGFLDYLFAQLYKSLTENYLTLVLGLFLKIAPEECLYEHANIKKLYNVTITTCCSPVFTESTQGAYLIISKMFLEKQNRAEEFFAAGLFYGLLQLLRTSPEKAVLKIVWLIALFSTPVFVAHYITMDIAKILADLLESHPHLQDDEITATIQLLNAWKDERRICFEQDVKIRQSQLQLPPWRRGVREFEQVGVDVVFDDDSVVRV